MLNPGDSFERELAGGQSHTYQLMLTAGQYLNLVAEQRGIDVVVSLFGPEGKKLIEVDSPNGTDGPEPLAWIAESSGAYRLEVRSPEKMAKAGRYEVKVVAWRAATEADRVLAKAFGLHNESIGLQNRSKFAEAIPPAERALTLREQALGPNHPDVAQSLNHLAVLHKTRGDYEKAEPLYQRALAVYEQAFGGNHPDVAQMLNNLAVLYKTKGDYGKAEPLYQRALAIYEQVYDANHPDIAMSLNNLGTLYHATGALAKAEPLLRRALSLWEQRLGPNHPDVASAHNNLAALYSDKGDLAKAEPLYQRALSIWEKARGPNHPDVAYALTNLAVLYHAQGAYAKALPLLQRALLMREQALGPNHPDVAYTLNNLALLYRDQGEVAQAEALNLRALAIRERAFGPQHPEVAHTLNNLAVLYANTGEYAKAEPLYQRALAIRGQALGPNHGYVAQSLSNLAVLYRAKKEAERALAFATRATEVSEFNLNRTLVAGSERQKLLFLARYANETNFILSLHAQFAPADPQALKLAFTTLLRRKGRALEAASDAMASLRRRANAEDRGLIDRLVSARSRLATATLRGAGRMAPEQFRAQLKRLADDADQLEAELSSRSAAFRAQTQPVSIEAIQAALPTDAALVEFATYRPYDAQARKNGPLRYVAYTLASQGEPRWVELGEAAPLEAAVTAWRQALRDKRRNDVKQLARAVDERVLRPVRALLGQTRRIFISPDGALNLIPFAALVDEHNRYLVQRYDFSYLTSGRDLLRLQVKQPSKQTALIAANPDFGEATKAGAGRQRGLVYRPGAQAVTGEGAVLAEYYFPPLQGTAEEARALKAMLADAATLTQAQATETALKQVSGPRLLHIATHGFFLENQPAAAEERGLKAGAVGEPAGAGQIENPLLRSGLALAGANLLAKDASDDGILTAQEAAGLDLWGTRLVVLSACDTGVGEVKNGEGVYGLRRALVLAGSETQVMSLWPVSDKGTRDLMIEYYRRLLRGEGRSAALRQVQLRMLASQGRGGQDGSRLLVRKGLSAKEPPAARDYSHPYYWASFIQSGEWRRLD